MDYTINIILITISINLGYQLIHYIFLFINKIENIDILFLEIMKWYGADPMFFYITILYGWYYNYYIYNPFCKFRVSINTLYYS